MPKRARSFSRFIGGIADYTREGIADSYAHGRSIDVRTDPKKITLLPRTIKESGNTVIDLPKWGETVGVNSYLYGDAGNFYKRDSTGSYSLLRTVANSHGNGLAYFGEDDYIYYTLDKVIGRYGPISGTPQFVDDWLGSQGGVPLNTSSLDLEASSSQYASRADTASLSITGNLAIEAQIKPESLPTVGNTMTLVSKWDESGATRSYKFDIAAVSGYFGDGSDSSLTISANTTDAPIDSACTGTISTTSLSATNASFTAGQIILIHQSRGTGAGTWMRNKIVSYSTGTITLETALNATYVSGAQVLVLKQYTNVTVNSSVTWTAKAWNGTVGGILAFIASGTVTVSGTITATAKGFRGGAASNSGAASFAGEGTAGATTQTTSANGNGGGGATAGGNGGGGGNATSGVGYSDFGGAIVSQSGGGGGTAGTADLTTMTFGGGGGGASYSGGTQGAGGNGGGAVFITGAIVTVSGVISADGETGVLGTNRNGGGGAGGSVLIRAQTATLGSSIVTAQPLPLNTQAQGGNGRIHLDYYTSYTGTTLPTLNVTLDNTLVVNTSYQLRLAVSTDGTALETLTREIGLVTGSWQEVAVSWAASTSTATFYLNADSLGTATGALTAISNNGSTFQIGMHKNSGGTATSFYDGLIDEVRVFSTTRSADDIAAGLNNHILTTTAGLQAYYKLNGDYNDASGNTNTLTGSGTPVFSSDVPYPAPTTRADIDQSADTSGDTYALATTLAETATHRKTFTPAKDPQKSVSVDIVAKGTGDWTLTVHDSLNNTIATKTVANASLATGLFEFVFSTAWRPFTNFTNSYHFHLTSTVADGTVKTTSSNDLETVTYRTHFQFLVTDTEWHPAARMLQFLVFGNERHVGKLEATLYDPNRVTLPAGYRVRCFGYWQEYLVIGTMQGTNIYDRDSGRIYFWDGTSDTYNFYVDIPEGGVNALFGTPERLYIYAGYQGDILAYEGGQKARKIRRIPKMAAAKYIEIYPGAVTMWKALLRFGVAGGGDSTAVERGVYTYGSLNERYPEALTYDYPISTGSLTGTSLKVGLTMVINKRLLIGWQDNTSYGVDYVDDANAPYPTGTIEFMIEDEDLGWKEKQANTLSAHFDPLDSTHSITPKYKVNDGSTWSELSDTNAENDVEARIDIPDGRYKEIQVAIDLATTGSTSPALHEAVYETDYNENEGRV